MVHVEFAFNVHRKIQIKTEYQKIKCLSKSTKHKYYKINCWNILPDILHINSSAEMQM